MKLSRSLLLGSILAFAAPLLAHSSAGAVAPDWALPLHNNVVVVGGTDDSDGKDQLQRMNGWLNPDAKVHTVKYPAAVFPNPLEGKPSYNGSAAEGITKASAEIQTATSPSTIVGISQGARVVGDAIAAHDTPANAGRWNAILLADPRFPTTGVEEKLKGVPIPGITLNGQRQSTQHIATTSVCIKGDPTCSFNGHPANFIPGFICFHADKCTKSNVNYGHLDELKVRNTWKEGETTYITIDAPHPWRVAAEEFGLTVSDRDEEFLHSVLPVGEPGV